MKRTRHSPEQIITQLREADSSQRTPNWGDDGPGQPGGFGIFQLTFFGSGQLPSSQDLWNWQQNVLTAKQVIVQKQASANSYMQGQRALAGGVPVPQHVVAGITFADGTDKPIEHAVAIKAYNAASSPPGSGLPGNYCFWNTNDPLNPHWDFSELNNLGSDYVQLICQEATD